MEPEITLSPRLREITVNAIEGIPASVEDALAADSESSTAQLAWAADRVRRAQCGDSVDTCAIINARSGRCGEDCRWCGQSAHWAAGRACAHYDAVDPDECLAHARANHNAGVKRFSLVTSGRTVLSADLPRFCKMVAEIRRQCPGMGVCASMGLLGRSELQMLKEAGVSRYHCNLETSPRFFSSLCSTHTTADKLLTISYAREVGLQVCSGGIIGMGESMRHRLELAEAARLAGAVSMPVNLLNPIPGTPLEHQPLLDEDSIVRSVALMRLVAPALVMRFAGGRRRLNPDTTLRILHGGMNGVMVGNLLTTPGPDLDADRLLLSKA